MDHFTSSGVIPVFLVFPDLSFSFSWALLPPLKDLCASAGVPLSWKCLRKLLHIFPSTTSYIQPIVSLTTSGDQEKNPCGGGRGSSGVDCGRQDDNERWIVTVFPAAHWLPATWSHSAERRLYSAPCCSGLCEFCLYFIWMDSFSFRMELHLQQLWAETAPGFFKALFLHKSQVEGRKVNCGSD